MSKLYAVRQGRVKGIFLNWEDCRDQVERYFGADYRTFNNVEDAYHYITYKGEEDAAQDAQEDAEADAALEMDAMNDAEEMPYAYVDGSYNPATKTYGYGGFLKAWNRKYPLMGCGDDKEMASMRNVAGEIEGAMAAVEMAERIGVTNLKILYDYTGIREWAAGSWKANKSGTQEYQHFMNSRKRKVKVVFEKVSAHSGIAGNEVADAMAKQAVGIALTKSQQTLVADALIPQNQIEK